MINIKIYDIVRDNYIEWTGIMYYTVFVNFKEKVIEKVISSDEEKYKIEISDITGTENCYISFEKRSDAWYVSEDQNISVSGSGKLENGKTIEISIKRTSVMAAVSAYEFNSETAVFEKYILEDITEIGNSDDSDIVIDTEFASRKHAVIFRETDGYVLKDLSRNGVYVNGSRINGEKHLEMFDSVWIAGVKIIFLGGIAALGNSINTRTGLVKADNIKPDHSVRKRNSCRTEIINDHSEEYDIVPVSVTPVKFKERTGFRKNLSDILKTSVPSAAVLSSACAVVSDMSVPAIAALFAGGTALMSGGWALAGSLYNKLLLKHISEENEKTGSEYLEKCYALIEEKQNNYRLYLNEKYLNADKAVRLYREGKRMIRMRGSSDFLKISIGTGKADFREFFDISSADKKTAEILNDKYSHISDVPLVLDLKSEKLFTVSGKKDLITDFITGSAVKISALYDRFDVKMMFIFSGLYMDEFRFVRWIPHVYSDDMSERFISVDKKSRNHLISYINGHFCTAGPCGRTDRSENTAPHCIVFISSEDILKEENIKRYLRSDTAAGVTFIYTRITEDDELTVSGAGNVLKTAFTDHISISSAVSYARLTARNSDAEQVSLPVPDSLGFLEMMGVENTEDIRLSESYSSHRTSESIKACIGYGRDNTPFVLDIHESAHGPHGLIAGTTGSGKSEVIQTFILSLAVKYSPDELAFVLIDYKGGGMSGAFEDLPHTAGILTNLSDNTGTVWRSLISLRSEIKRRQTVLKRYGLSHADRYAELFRNGKADEPMPHLVIICDEFAELKRENPEFISQLVSISRVGRSLGIHLILATQKPSGVIDDEIRSNSGFRICLRVQDRTDSMEMLEKTDAAEISVTGRAYVQACNNSVYELIQTGYTGMDYSPYVSSYDVRMVRDDLSDAVSVKESKKDNGVTQLQAVTEHISDFCKKEGICHVRKLWNDPLPDMPYLSDVSLYGNTDYSTGLVCTAGITDDPENQDMYPAVFDMYESRNMIISGRSGSGKTTLIGTMICSLAENYPADVFRFSVIDMSGGLFSVYGRLPQCDRIMTSPDDYEISDFISYLSDEITRRKRLFSEFHAADFSEYREQENDLAAHIVYIDGYYLFREMYPSLEESFIRISGESAKYGIYIVITIKQAADIRIRTRQNFHTSVSLAMNDRTEYTELLGIRPETELYPNTGRGYIKYGKRLLEFQTAVCCTGTGREKLMQLSERFARIRSRSDENETEYDAKLYCSFADAENEDQYLRLTESISGKGRTIVWSKEHFNYDFENDSTEIFIGKPGAYDMLLMLREIFSERNTVKKISGKYEGDEITVVLCGLDDFCRCIYEKGREDMSSITETFFRGGSGLGIRFVSGKTEHSDYEAYRIFSSYSKGGEYA